MNIPYLPAYKHISRASLFNIATLQHTLSFQTLDTLRFPYYKAVDSTPNRDVSKRRKKSKQNARSKWDAPGFFSKLKLKLRSTSLICKEILTHHNHDQADHQPRPRFGAEGRGPDS
jgi:hypothetical protein